MKKKVLGMIFVDENSSVRVVFNSFTKVEMLATNNIFLPTPVEHPTGHSFSADGPNSMIVTLIE